MSKRFGQVLVGLVSIAAVGLALISSQAQADPAFNASEQCKALVEVDFSQTPDAPTQITNASVVNGAEQKPSYCRIQGYITPNIGIELRLPASGWNGKFLKVGCGGMCGRINAEHCEFAIRRGYACIASDMGHTSTIHDGKWAYNNLQGEVDFAYRATHVATLAGKAITERYYRKTPERSYFIGCSQGGRQALVEAQRFPSDFDGIIAGAPVINSTMSALHILWASRLTQTEAEARTPVLSAQAIKQVHEKVLGQCDANDGLADGLISNPQTCRFDPTQLACSFKNTNGCLTTSQVDVIKKFYSGFTNSAGDKLYWGTARGSELNWLGSFFGTTGDPPYQKFAIELFRYMVYMPDLGPLWQPAHFDLNNAYQRFGLMESLYSAANPDLRRFKAAGGKLLIYTGWNDALVPPGGIIDYYETVERTMGGRTATQEFARLFMLPGVDHCVAADGANTVDYLTHMENWVERGQAPERMVSTHLKEEGEYSLHKSFPLDPSNVLFTRPIYPYPIWAKYAGSGDPKQADHFEPVTAE